ncbi:MAG: thiamine pyrophosphate-dependent dehydrogenase E1 component subunit alpha, partial [Thermomonas sp.]
EERIAAVYAEQEMRCPVHLYIGQEAVAIGAGRALRPGDYAVSAHRSHAHYLAKGGNLDAMIAELYGKEAGCCHGKGGSMHLIDVKAGFMGAVPIVGSTIPIGVGLGFASSMKKDSRVTAVFFGEGSTEEGVFSEAVNFAVLKKLPVVFVCENNLFSVYSPLSVRQPPGRQVFEHARSYGLPSHQADGNDVEGVEKLVREAADRARAGEGPTFLEFMTYRWREHCGPNYDDHLGYRDEAEFASWKARCPLTTLETRLLKEGVLTDAQVTQKRADIDAELDQAFKLAKEGPFPAPDMLYRHMFAAAEGAGYLK